MLVSRRNGSPRVGLTHIKVQRAPVLDSSCFVGVVTPPRRRFMDETSLQSDRIVRLAARGILRGILRGISAAPA